MSTFANILESVWAITPSAYRTLLENARLAQPEAAAQFKPVSGLPVTRNDRKIAIISISGPIVDRPTYWTGGISHVSIQDQFLEAISDPEVAAIIFSFDSPGGQVTSCCETSAIIRAGRSKKPIVCHAHGMLCSAAYWIGSAAGRVVAGPTAIVGCLGIQATIVDFTKAYAQIGIEELTFISSQTPLKNADPKTDAGRTAAQKTVDDLAAVMLSDIALNRGISLKTVSDNYGQGATFVGSAAVAAGLADSVGTLDDVINGICKHL